jgi:cell division protein FtsZ
MGAKAAQVDAEKIAEVVKGTDLVFLIAGLGGGTGSGAAPVIAEIASQNGAVVIAFVTLPFSFEGGRRRKQAEEALTELRRVCDAVIPLSNDMLLQDVSEETSVLDSFARADEWIGRGVKSIWSMLSRTGLINVDFTAVRTVFHQRGVKTLFGLGVGEGDNAAMAAFEDLKQCPLLHTPEYARKADRILVNITGGADLSLTRVNELMSAITEEFGREAHVVMGASIDEALQGKVEICVMGAADASGRNFVRRSPVAIPPRKSAADKTAVPFEMNAASPETTLREAEARKRPSAAWRPVQPGVKDPADKPKQDEFGFQEEPVENRGSFEKSDRNLFEGQDLDVPTYLRKGIKVVV